MSNKNNTFLFPVIIKLMLCVYKSSVINPELGLMLLLIEGFQNTRITLRNKLQQLLSVVKMNIQLLKPLQDIPKLLIFVRSMLSGKRQLCSQVRFLLLITFGDLFQFECQYPLDSLDFGPVSL